MKRIHVRMFYEHTDGSEELVWDDFILTSDRMSVLDDLTDAITSVFESQSVCSVCLNQVDTDAAIPIGTRDSAKCMMCINCLRELDEVSHRPSAAMIRENLERLEMLEELENNQE